MLGLFGVVGMCGYPKWLGGRVWVILSNIQGFWDQEAFTNAVLSMQ